jgi:hypothetical protein
MPDIPCAACARRASNPEAPEWRDMLAALDLGHDTCAHRVYWALAQRGVGPDVLAAMTDGQLLAWPNFGVGMLARVRSRVPAPLAATATDGHANAS